MFIFTLTAALLAIGSFLLAFFIFITKGHHKHAQSLALAILFFGVWMIGNAKVDLATTIPEVIFYNVVLTIGITCYIMFFYFFVYIFTHPNNSIPRTHIITFVIFTGAFILLSPTEYAFSDIQFPSGRPVEESLGIMWLIFLLYYIAAHIMVFIPLYKYIQTHDTKEKDQASYMLAGSLLAFLGGIFFDLILPFLGELRYYNLGPQFSFFFISATCYAIFKHQLLDIKVALQRSIIYVFLGVVTILVYISLLFSLDIILITKTDSQLSILSGLITTLIGIFTFPHIETYLRKITDTLFFQDTYEYSSTMYELCQITNANLNQREIIQKTEKKLMQIFRAKWAYVELNNTTGVAPNLNEKINNAHIFIPLYSSHKKIGTILLGKKNSGDSFSKKDLSLLFTYSHQCAVALEKAVLYEQVQDYSKDLEIKIQERTKELVELQERQSQVLLDISHGLQTPLTIIKGELATALAPIEKNNPSIHRSLDYISAYINDLLLLAQMDAPSTNQYKKISLSKEITDVVEYFTVMAEQKGITVQSQIEKDICIYADTYQIQELAKNLLSNAIKFIDTKKYIQVSLSKDMDTAILICKDSGCGIPANDLPHIFKRFYRSSSTNKKHGSGLGLAICASIVKNHNGKIHAASSPGKGTTITVELPL